MYGIIRLDLHPVPKKQSARLDRCRLGSPEADLFWIWTHVRTWAVDIWDSMSRISRGPLCQFNVGRTFTS